MRTAASTRPRVASRAQEEEDDERAESFGLTWPGKRAAVRDARTPASGRLVTMPRAAHRPAETESVVVEGDSLAALKLLRRTLLGKVKLVYIDPPYNCGNDGVYVDRFVDTSLDGERARAHARWLSMMYPRLAAARDLLREDGAVFVSIDERELAHLDVLMTEVFGESNRQGIVCWRRRYNQPNDKTKMLAKVAEWIVVYAKDARALRASGVGKLDLTGSFANADGDPRGAWATKPWKVGSDQSGTRYALTTPAGVTYEETWMGERATYEKLLADGRIVFPKEGRGAPRKKYFLSERAEEGQCATNWWTHERFGHNQGANQELTRLFGAKNVFTNPKPLALLRAILQVANVRKDDWVLDFFAGSGTTAHAVHELNASDGGARRFALVQVADPVPEGTPAFELGLRTLSDIARDRLRRAKVPFRAQRVVEGA
jgi:adenine-specific DNA-methyltransferase